MATVSSGKIVAGILTTFLCFLSMNVRAADPDYFQKYVFPHDGLEVSFPSKPLEFRTESKAGNSYSNVYQAQIVNPISQYSVFVQHSSDKVFSDKSVDAYLDGIVRGLMLGSDNPVLHFTKRIHLKGLPAIEYQYAHTASDVPVIGRGIVVMVDGNHIRLSQIYTKSEVGADRKYNKYIASFSLIPLKARLSTRRYENKLRGIAFSPPEGWKEDATKHAQIPAIFSSPTGHMVQIIDSSTPGYTCDHYKNEMLATQGIQGSGVIVVRGRSMNWIKSTAYQPAAKIRMTGIHYCLNTSRGAIILNGMTPEVTFIRSEKIFHKVAESLVARN